MKKFTYALAAVAMAAFAVTAQADETNLMSGWITGAPNSVPAAPWVAYNTASQATGNGNGWQIRNTKGENTTSGTPGLMFFRWNDNNSSWVYGYEFQAVEDHDYTLTFKASDNDNKQQTMYVGAGNSFAQFANPSNAVNYSLAGHNGASPENTNADNTVDITYNFTATADGQYYMIFGLVSPKNGNNIIRAWDFVLVDKGEHAYTAAEYEALKNEVWEFFEAQWMSEESDYGAYLERMFDLPYLMTITDMLYEDEIPADVTAAYKELNSAYIQFKSEAPIYYAYFAIATQAEFASMNYPYASEGSFADLMAIVGMGQTPATAESATEKANQLVPALRKVIESNAVAGKYANAEAIEWGAWTSNGFGTNQGEGPTMANGEKIAPYYDKYQGGMTTAVKTMQLAAGKYLFAMLNRGNLEGFSLKITGAGDEITEDLFDLGNQGNQFGNGWGYTVVPFVMTEAGEVTFTVSADLGSGKWVSFLDPKITLMPIVLPEVQVDFETIESDTYSFEGSIRISFSTEEDIDIYYNWTENDETPTTGDVEFTAYTRPFQIEKSGVLKYYAESEGIKSEVKTVTFTATTTGVEIIGADNGDAEYYSISGARVNGTPAAGVYVVRKNGVATKVIIK